MTLFDFDVVSIKGKDAYAVAKDAVEDADKVIPYLTEVGEISPEDASKTDWVNVLDGWCKFHDGEWVVLEQFGCPMNGARQDRSWFPVWVLYLEDIGAWD